jgi:hypothetical protein
MHKRVAIAMVLAVTPTISHSYQTGSAGFDNVPPEGTEVLEKNSKHCPFTLFSNDSDSLDLAGANEKACFDLKAGDDSLRIDPNSKFLSTSVFTGPGRDTVRLSNVSDRVETFDDRDAEIDLRGGDDELFITGVLAEGLANPGSSENTLIRTGAGSDVISFGSHDLDGLARLRSPELEIDPNGEGRLDLRMGCERYLDDRTFDVTVPASVKGKAIFANLSGCGASFAAQASPLKLEQVGGRLSIGVKAPHFGSVMQPVDVNVDVNNGSVFSGNFELTSRASSLSWQGFGLVTFKADFDGPNTGGDFSFETEDKVFGEINLANGDASFNAHSGEKVEIVLKGAMEDADHRLNLLAPEVVISWTPEQGNFPSIKIPSTGHITSYDGFELNDTVETLEAISWQDERRSEEHRMARLGDEAKMISKEKRREAARREEMQEYFAPSPYEARDKADQTRAYHSAAVRHIKIKRNAVEVADVELRIHRSNADGECYAALLRDLDGVRPDVMVGCDDPWQKHPATDFEMLELKSSEGEVIVEINGDSEFRVDHLVLLN